MITVDDDGEFTFTIFDLIKELKELDKFVIKIWTHNSELAFTYDESSDYHFLQEAIKVTTHTESVLGDKERVNYITLDSIVSVVIFKDEDIREVW